MFRRYKFVAHEEPALTSTRAVYLVQSSDPWFQLCTQSCRVQAGLKGDTGICRLPYDLFVVALCWRIFKDEIRLFIGEKILTEQRLGKPWKNWTYTRKALRAQQHAGIWAEERQERWGISGAFRARVSRNDNRTVSFRVHMFVRAF